MKVLTLSRRLPVSLLVALALLSVLAASAGAATAEPGDLVPLRSGPGTPLRDGDRVIVNVRFDSGALASLAALRAAGAEVVEASRRYQTVTVAAKPGQLKAIAGLTRVGGVTEVAEPLVLGADCGGSFRSEGDSQLRASTARFNLGLDGTGVGVGILSDSFDRAAGAATHAAGDVASGDLPGPGSPCGTQQPVGLRSEAASGSDEGRAMAQIVRDLAPGASIDFATAFSGELAFAEAIRGLAAAGNRVIADDVIYFEEPFFQDGPVAVAVDEVDAAGVSYYSAAGNFNEIAGGRDVASYEAPFRDAGGCPAGVPAAETECMDFDPGPGVDSSFEFRLGPGESAQFDLQWAEPLNGVATDLDAFVISGGAEVSSSVEDNVGSSQRPYELVSVENKSDSTVTASLAISRYAGPMPPSGPVLKFVDLGASEPTPSQLESSSGDTIGPAIFGHAAASGANAVAAVRFDTTSLPEAFSSRGPVVHYYGPVLGTAPAAPLSGPETRHKPDLAATDGAVNTFFGSPSGGFWRFFGTSAAAPHAAAAAALVLEANPGATPAQVRTALRATARPVGSFGPDAVGAGLIDAAAATSLVALPPTVAITAAPAALSRETQPTIQFTANRPTSFACVVDGAALPCTSPFTWPQPLGDGSHSVQVFATDVGGRAGASAPAAFRTDTTGPRTRIVKRPRKRMGSHRARVRVVFRFRSSEGGNRFRCKLDRGRLRRCNRKIVRHVRPGRHVIKVKAFDALGNVDPSPAVYRWRILRRS